MTGSALALLVPVVGAFFGLSLLWPLAPTRTSSLVKLTLAVPFGLGLSSVGFFLWLVAIGPRVTGFLALEIAAAIALAGIALRRRAIAGWTTDTAGEVAGRQARLLYVVLALLLVLSLASFAAFSAAHPHGWWDAIAIWNSRARFIARGGEHWTDGLTTLLGWTHPDYPLLLPGIIAHAWKVGGSDSTAVPISVAFLFTFCCVGLLVAGVASLRGRRQGVVAGIALLGSAPLVWHGAIQYADIPLALYILVTLTLLAVWDGMSPSRADRLLVLSGVAAGLAAWTKNEGLVFVFTLLLVRLAVAARAQGWRASTRQVGLIGLGLLPVLLVVIGFKLTLAPTNDLLSRQALAGVLGRLGDPARYTAVLSSLLQHVARFGDGWVGMPVVLTAYAALVGLRRRPHGAPAVATIGITLGILLAIYTFVLLATPWDVQWHVYTALYRLLMQLWPAALLGFFLAVRTVNEAMNDKSPAANAQGPRSAIAR